MKNIITSMVALFAIVLSFSAIAKPPADPLSNHSATKIALLYVEALTTGNIAYNKFLYTDNFTYENATNDQVASRRQYLNYLKATEGLHYNCKTTYEVMDQTGDTAIAKTTMEFDNFTRIDYITIELKDEGWKIDKVITTFP